MEPYSLAVSGRYAIAPLSAQGSWTAHPQKAARTTMTEPSPAPLSPAASDVARLFTATLAEGDPEVARAVGEELGRQRDEIELIASENIVSRAVLEAQGSVLTNKYAEGLPGRRYYGGCQYVDI